MALPLYMKVGIFFGGASREREISFAGGRTVYDNLDKSLFEAIPIFVDSNNRLIQLNWPFVYKGTIRDFYPPVQFLPQSLHHFQHYVESLDLNAAEYDALIAAVGKEIKPHELNGLIDFAFLALHGEYGEDGSIQGMLQWFKIPYTGSGVLPSSFGMNKSTQKRWMTKLGFHSPKYAVLKRESWLKHLRYEEVFQTVQQQLGFPIVIKPANQGSSVGATILSNSDLHQFVAAIDKAFFIQVIDKAKWQSMNESQQINFVRELTDIREGLGLPIQVKSLQHNLPVEVEIKQADDLLNTLTKLFTEGADAIQLDAYDGEKEVLIEGFIKGREFSCIVIEDEHGDAIALPPTEIVKGQELFDYRSKYMPGLSRKVTPIRLPDEQIEQIRKECQRLFEEVQFDVYARIDGFITDEGKIFLNDPNTTSGMLPSSFFFHQSAEIGLNPSQFLTYIIYTSIRKRIGVGASALQYRHLFTHLEQAIRQLKSSTVQKKRVGVIMGGYSSERHISIESGRNIYEKLASSGKYDPVPIFLTGSAASMEMYVMPISVLLKDNADDIKEKIDTYHTHPILEKIKEECKGVTDLFAAADVKFAPQRISFEELAGLVDAVFIALHGRPGEDGTLQQELLKFNISFNGSGIASSQTTINKYDTLQLLKSKGFIVTKQKLVYKNDFKANPAATISTIEAELPYPFIAKPVDDGCSSAVKKIKNAAELKAYLELLYREQLDLMETDAAILHLKPKEEFPQKEVVLLEELISKGDAAQFMEITGGMLTHFTEEGKVMYEVFEPSEALADGEVLSLEEKFLAGQGQNITPARFATDAKRYKLIAKQVKKTLEDAAVVLNVEGYCRIDAFVRIYEDGRAETIIIEVNSLPGMTPATCIYHQAAINDYQPFQFIDKILEYGIKRQAAHA